MRLLYFSDLHADSRQVAKRTGSYLEDVCAKLEEIRESAKGCDYTIFGGDLFDRWEVKPETEIRVINILRDWPHTMFAVRGNHEMPPDYVNASRRGSIGVIAAALEGTDRITFLDEDVLLDTVALKVQVSATHWSPALEKPDSDPAVYSLDRNPRAMYAIKIGHGMVLPPGGGYPFPATGMNEIDTTGIDLFLAAHTHWRQAPLELPRAGGGTCTFYGPGSVARTARSQDHTPSVAVIAITLVEPSGPTIAPDGAEVRELKVDIEEIALKSARPHAEVFGPEDEHVPGSNLFEGYASALEQSGAANTMSPEEALAQLAAAGTAPEVIEGARAYLTRAQEGMKQ